MYYENRVADFNKLQEENDFNAYPHKFNVTMSVPHIIASYQHLQKDEQLREVVVGIAGRIMSVRSNSAKLKFYDIQADGSSIQIIANKR